jgi:hypothetical protein
MDATTIFNPAPMLIGREGTPEISNVILDAIGSVLFIVTNSFLSLPPLLWMQGVLHVDKSIHRKAI